MQKIPNFIILSKGKCEVLLHRLYIPERTNTPVFSDRRIKRGQYWNANGKAINVDLNGADKYPAQSVSGC